MNTERFTGPQAFGKAYTFMLDHDTHAPGSVDRTLVSAMVRLREETADCLYSRHTSTVVRYVKGSRPSLEEFIFRGLAENKDADKIVEAVVNTVKGIASYAPRGLDNMRFGGTEEQIIERGSAWCTDVARVACILYQICGIPSRIVNLFDLQAAYSGHVIVEVFRSGKWGAVDSSSAVVYRKDDGAPISTWELMNNPLMIDKHAGPTAWYTTRAQFAAAAVCNYSVERSAAYDFTVSSINDYYRTILDTAARGWPGGLRWLHGEAEA